MVSPVGGYAVGSLSDYFGLPTAGQVGASNTVTHSSLWHRAYNLIWNEWFRDQNLQNAVVVDKGDGPDNNANYVLLKRGKRHDYFTSCLPWPQKGASVPLPLTGNAPVVSSGVSPVFATASGAGSFADGTMQFHSGGGVNRFMPASKGTATNNQPVKFGSVTGLQLICLLLLRLQ